MAISITLNGTTYSIPSSGNTGWGATVTSYLSAVAGYLTATQAASAPAIMSFGAATTTADQTARYMRPGYATPDTTEVFIRAPFAGTVSALYVQATTGPVTAGQVLTVRLNGVDQTLTATLAAAATQAADATHSFTVAAGDRISVKVQGAASIATGAINLVVSMKLTYA